MQCLRSWVPRLRRRRSPVTRTMLIQANCPYGSVAAVATTRLSTRAAWTVPSARKISQSAATWFQPASRTSASASGNSAAVSDAPMIGSEGAIACIEMCVLAEARHAARDPVGCPVDHACQRHVGLSEQPDRFRDVDQPGVGRFRALEDRILAEALAELIGEPTDAGRRAADVERARRHRTMIERAQDELVGVALPDHVDV